MILNAEKVDTEKKPFLIATLGPSGTCSEKAANYYAKRFPDGMANLLCTTFEEAIMQVRNKIADYAIVPSAYRNIAGIIFDNIEEIAVIDTFVLPTPNLVIAVLEKNKEKTEFHKIASHASPMGLAQKVFPNAEFILTTSNSVSALQLVEEKVDACITTKVCADRYQFHILKDFGEVPMGWNVFQKKEEHQMKENLCQMEISNNHYLWPMEFYQLFLDTTLSYSCADFGEDGTMDLEQAQYRKIDEILETVLQNRSCHKILDIGCGWGSVVRRAASKYQVDAVGIDASDHYFSYCLQHKVDKIEFIRADIYDYKDNVDGIICVGALEHIKSENYDRFFKHCNHILNEKGRICIQTQICENREFSFDLFRFNMFCRKQMDLNLELPKMDVLKDVIEANKFRMVSIKTLDKQYYNTVKCWEKKLIENEAECTRLIGKKAYDNFLYVITNMGNLHRDGIMNVYQIVIEKETTINE